MTAATVVGCQVTCPQDDRPLRLVDAPVPDGLLEARGRLLCDHCGRVYRVTMLLERERDDVAARAQSVEQIDRPADPRGGRGRGSR